jgi:hypothetical protein
MQGNTDRLARRQKKGNEQESKYLQTGKNVKKNKT